MLVHPGAAQFAAESDFHPPPRRDIAGRRQWGPSVTRGNEPGRPVLPVQTAWPPQLSGLQHLQPIAITGVFARPLRRRDHPLMRGHYETRMASAATAIPPMAAWPDARYIVFSSDASDLVPGDTNGYCDVFSADASGARDSGQPIHDRRSRRNGPSCQPVLTPDGRYIAFVSASTNLAAAQLPDVYLRDLTGRTTVAASSGLASASTSAVIAGLSIFHQRALCPCSAARPRTSPRKSNQTNGGVLRPRLRGWRAHLGQQRSQHHCHRVHRRFESVLRTPGHERDNGAKVAFKTGSNIDATDGDL